MVEKQACDVNLSDTGVLSKENEETRIKGISEAQEVTDYWDISGAMETAPGSADESSGKMKLHNAADETEINRFDDREVQNGERSPNDNVTTDSANASRGSDAMEPYCENGQSAIDENGPKNSLNNSNLDTSDSQQHNGMSESPAASAEDTENNNTGGNATTDQRERDTVGTDTAHNAPTHNDVNDTRPDNTDNSGALDNGADGDNKTELSIRDKMMLDSECTEERFRIDRKKLEQMLQAATEGRGQSGEEFFQKIMDDTQTFITWPSKLKIGAKSKKDPHIRICGKPDNIKEARQRIMLSLDTKSNRVTIKMDVSHTEHSHVIGKGGNNIKRVMQETGCHIHFPDSNRNNAAEKSNQVSITGHPEGVENARQKIRNLLPIVLQFEIPNAGVPMPDLNSPMIQHLVQVYGISIQFKQRVKVYSTSCTVRGSSDNIDGLKTGVQTLMNHTAGSQLPVTTQIEIAPQHHPYMLSKTGLNVNAIIQSTGARIIFPDPNALPKKSTVYINGSIDSVIVARHKLMGCLPLLLMFDIKADADETSHDGSAVANLMESLDIFINIKLKPKQPSKTVIIKGMEHNIYNMFDARAKLLGLDSSGITRPAHSLSPKLAGTPSIPPNPVSPVILLSRTHVTTPSVQTHIIGLDQKTITPLPCAVLGGPGYVLTHGVTSNPGTPRPMSAVHTPSQSPYPTLTTNGGIVQAMTSPIHASRDCSSQNAHSRTPSRTQDEFSPNYGMVNHNMSPPNGIPSGQPSLRPEQKAYAENMAAQAQQRLQQRGANVDTNVMANDSLANIRRNSNPIPDKYGYVANGGTPYKNQEYLQQANIDAAKQNTYPNMAKSPLNGMKMPYENHRTILPPSTYNSNSNNSVPSNQYTSASAAFQSEYQKGIHTIPGTFSPLLAGAVDGLNRPLSGPLTRQPVPAQLAEQQLKQANQFPQQTVRTQEGLARQHYSIANQVGNLHSEAGSMARTAAHNSIVRSNSATNQRQAAVQNMYSPESVSGSRTSLNSDAMSPMSSISDRFIENPNTRLGYEPFEEPQMRSPPSPAHQSGIFQPLVNRDLNSLSPLNTHAHRSPPHIVVNPSVDAQFDPTLNDDSATSIADMYNQTQGGDITTRPPPGFEAFTPPQGHKDYDNLSKLAEKAMKNKPVTSEIRTPTDVWAGWGFSKSMPFEMREELKKLAASKGRFKNNLPPTYENGDDDERNQPSPVNEEEEDGLGLQYGSRLRVPFPHHNLNKGGSSLKAWRQRNVMNLSLGGHMGLNFIPGGHRRNQQRPRENASAFVPVPQNESPNRPSSSPKANPPPETLPPTRPVNNSPFSSSGNERTLSFPRPEKPAQYDARINMSSTPTIQDSLGLNANAGSKVEADISDVLNRLDLAKYTSVFQQQEVDFQTFLTLTEPDLKELGITTFGPRKKILLAIKDLNKERDVFSGPASKDSPAHENISDQMLQLQRLQLQQHRDNPQTTTPSRLDTHSLLSPSRQLFAAPNQYAQNRLDAPPQNAERRGVFHGGQHMPNDRMRPMNTSRLWQNSKAGISSSGHW